MKTKTHAYSVLRAILNYAIAMDYIVKSPLSKVGNFKDALHTKSEKEQYDYGFNFVEENESDEQELKIG